ncbi:ABC transporter ATP-binding protein [Corynebacterium sp.]|uniref:ATP-binding cassette domain-containing protein n=1 Tax=Corynebacterium sp. TaxID=1720 RepID=UPI0026DA6EE1|nr:ABC transporter ATP-binding protein [Corynebacterium sp.]MDO5076462.1 ABC transporter ATP-binding protein [Corynebacterium sp.]
MNNVLPDYRGTLRFIHPHFNGHWVRLAAAVTLAVCAAMFEVVLVSLVWQALASIADRSKIVTIDTGRIIGILAVFAVIAVAARQFFFGLSSAVSHLVSFDVLATIRKRLGRAWISTPVTRRTHHHSENAKTLAIDHCARLEAYIARAIPEATVAATVWLVVTLWLLGTNFWLTLATIAVVPAALYALVRAHRASTPLANECATAEANMNAAFARFFAALPQARTLHRADELREVTVAAATRHTNAQHERIRALVPWGSQCSTLMASGLVFVAPLGAWLYQSERIDAASLILFFVLCPIYTLPVIKALNLATELAELHKGTQQLAEVLADAEPTDPTDHSTSTAAPETTGDAEITFDNVSVEDPDGQPVLSGVSFTIPADTTTAIVASPARSATAIMDVLLGLRAPASGVVRVGGRGVDTLPDGTTNALFAAVRQQPMLSSGSVRENLLLAAPTATQQECEEALATVGVSELTDGLDTHIDTADTQLQQQLSVARALVARRPITVVQPPDVGDPAATLALQRGMSELVRTGTNVLVSPQLPTVVHADQILVLAAGELVECGTHDELLAADGAYARMWSDHHDAMELALRPEQEQ